jgi:hypothetical protein
MTKSEIQKRIQERSHLLHHIRVKELLRLDAERGKFRTRQIATPDAKVLGNVAENVGELQPFTKTDGSGFHEGRVPVSQ